MKRRVNRNYRLINDHGFTIDYSDHYSHTLDICIYRFICGVHTNQDKCTHTLSEVLESGNFSGSGPFELPRLYQKDMDFSVFEYEEFALKRAKPDSDLDILMSQMIDDVPVLKSAREALDISAALPATPIQQAPRKPSKRL